MGPRCLWPWIYHAITAYKECRQLRLLIHDIDSERRKTRTLYRPARSRWCLLDRRIMHPPPPPIPNRRSGCGSEENNTLPCSE